MNQTELPVSPMVWPAYWNDYQKFIQLSRYSRWRDDLQSREGWSGPNGTVARTFRFWRDWLAHHYPSALPLLAAELAEAEQAVHDLEVMPSMRLLMTAGPAVWEDNLCSFNCFYQPIDNVRAIPENLYILMNGTGVGYSVERKYVKQLPVVGVTIKPDETGRWGYSVASELTRVDKVIMVADSKRGWAEALEQLLDHLWRGELPTWDVSLVRPAGSRLRTFGGRASGPEPLVALFTFCVKVFSGAVGRQLTPIEVHDIMCQVADCVVVGGVRRSALISLSDLEDREMMLAKTQRVIEGHDDLDAWGQPQPKKWRYLSNNSVAYNERPEFADFFAEWVNLYHSYNGERGIYNRKAAQEHARRIGRDPDQEFGPNPCAEINNPPGGLCNLTEAVVRVTDDEQTLARKVRIAAFLGTLQTTLTHFQYVGDHIRQQAERERLMGVSLTGIMDSPLLNQIEGPDDLPGAARIRSEQVLRNLRLQARTTNVRVAGVLGINPSVAVTTVKPSGTVSQLVLCASGIHEGYAPFYIRRVRNDRKDPISQLLIDAGVPYEQDRGKPHQVVFEFPMQHQGAQSRGRTAIQQLDTYLSFKENYTDHNVSISVYYTPDEFMGVGDWVWRHFDRLNGVSFFPKNEHIYDQAPYQEITEAEYRERVRTMPIIPWDTLSKYESTDLTANSRTIACAGGQCEWHGQ